MSNADLIRRLRALARAEHDDLSIGDEAADALEALEPQYCAYCKEIVRAPEDCPYDGRVCRLMNVEDYEPSDADLHTERMSAKSEGEVRHEMEQAKRLK